MKGKLWALIGLFSLLTLSSVLATHGGQHGCTVCGTNIACTTSDGECMISVCGANCYRSNVTGTTYNNCDPNCGYPGSESNCNDNIDNDCDGSIDSADSDCSVPENCGVVGDEDGDGDADCADSDCDGQTGPSGQLCCQSASTCDDGKVCTTDSCTSNTCSYTNNNNACGTTSCPADSCTGVTTYYDYSSSCTDTCSSGSCQTCTCTATNSQTCSSGLECTFAAGDCSTSQCHRTNSGSWLWEDPAGFPSESACSDGYDNDCDGNVDGADSDCSTTENTAALCSDSSDNDFDGDIDCADSDCNTGYVNACDSTSAQGCTRSTGSYNSCDLSSASSCGTESACSDGVDNDCDGYNNENDADCGISLSITPVNPAPGSTVTVNVNAADGSLDISGTLNIRQGSCSGTIVCSGNGCTFNAPSSTTTYYACIGQNSDSYTVIPTTSETSCSDGSDNDGNGFTDEQDAACPIAIDVTPEPATWQDSPLTATITASDSSLAQTVNIKEGGCGGSTLCTVNTNGGSCNINIAACDSVDKTYYACLGQNSPSDFVQLNMPAESGAPACNDNSDNDCNFYQDEADSSCTTETSFSINPGSSVKGQSVQSTLSAVDGNFQTGGETANFCDFGVACDGAGNCLGSTLPGCSNVPVDGQSSVNCNFNAPGTDNTYTYWVCLGNNEMSNTLTVSTPSENCDDGSDNDVDTYVDEADSDCSFTLNLPSNVNPGQTITASIQNYGSNLDTGGLAIEIRSGSPTGTTECTISGTTCSFTGPISGSEIYYAVVVGGNQSSPPSSTVQVNELCDNNLDDDGDGDVDDGDPDCPINVAISPDPVPPGHFPATATVTPQIGSVLHSGTDNFYIKWNTTIGCSDPGSQVVIGCTQPASAFQGQTSVSCQFTAPSTPASYVFYACIGNNTNQASYTLSVQPIAEDPSNSGDDDYDGFPDEADAEVGISLSFFPNPANVLRPVNATVSADDGLFYTGSYNLTLYESSTCSGTAISSCDKVNINGLSAINCSFTAPSTGAPQNYTACIGENSVTATLQVNVPPENCDNNFDDDADGDTDEADTDCTLGFQMNPQPDVCPGEPIHANLSNYGSSLNTGGKVINISLNNCANPPNSTITPPADSVSFASQSTTGSWTYYACVGSNQNSSVIGTSTTSVNGGGNLSGTVTDESGNPLDQVLVRAIYPPAWGVPEDTTLTDASGNYNFQTSVGSFVVSFEKANYFTVQNSTSVSCISTTILDAVLPDGECNDACVNWENRCNAACDGRVFQTGSCNFYDVQARSACDGQRSGVWAKYNQSPGQNQYYVSCCEGAPFLVKQPQALVTGNVDHLYKRERIVKDSNTGQPIRLVIHIWPQD